jgi:hypothetical protein
MHTHTRTRRLHRESVTKCHVRSYGEQHPHEHTSLIIMRVSHIVTHGTCHTAFGAHAFTHEHAQVSHLMDTVSQTVILEERVVRLRNRTRAHTPHTHTHAHTHLLLQGCVTKSHLRTLSYFSRSCRCTHTHTNTQTSPS